ncbi:hypothetical protein J0A68_14965 [Algoriphagus sp. H41]|uniref:Outer membrane protein beta-barrel domain-containing protein n=1 Tax=Algoriphagus oliviformis TaxID=2811231 RepID=A0ABS3C5H8_9BACT|nr:hypothetical protein [Algoriphagus oliviformis]MBN7812253.1 hypothetical protein [Algoriphagus oliviformis]
MCIYFLAVSTSYGQQKTYYNQTEFGVMFGRSENQWSGETEERSNFTMLTFHGARIAKHHVVGFSFGFDNYETVQIIPIALGWRGFLGADGKAQLVGGFDLGGGSTILADEEKSEWGRNWWEGGIMASPSIGVYIPATNGNTALTISVAYKRQQLFQFNGTYDRIDPSVQLASASLPPGFNSLTETKYLFQSLVLRAGLSF